MGESGTPPGPSNVPALNNISAEFIEILRWILPEGGHFKFG